jgi:hypothetical protein
VAVKPVSVPVDGEIVGVVEKPLDHSDRSINFSEGLSEMLQEELSNL